MLLRQLRKIIEAFRYRCWVKRYDTMTEKRRVHLLQCLAQTDSSLLPKISVILPVYNPPLRFLQEAIASVRSQLFTHWELCIVDDGSTHQEVLSYLHEIEKKDPRIKIIFCKKNRGIAAATNEALNLCSGDFVTFLDHDDVLSLDALGEVALAIAKNLSSNSTDAANSFVAPVLEASSSSCTLNFCAPSTPCSSSASASFKVGSTNSNVGFLYTDEDKLDRWGRRCDPFFKPDWNPALLESLNYCSHLSVIRRSFVMEAGGINTTVEGAQDWDLILRITERLHSDQIIHIPKILYHWRISNHSTARSVKAKPHIIEAGRRVLEEHFQRIGRSIKGIEQVHEGGHWKINFEFTNPSPLVSIIIPTRNRRDLLERCIQSIQSKTDYSNYEILIADNDSDDPAILEYYRQLEDYSNIRILKTPGPFNYSAINNRAVAHARGEILVLLNNDIEVTHPSWLSELITYAIRSDVGAVGALLCYPNGRIQHAGVILGIGGIAGHVGKNFREQCYVGGNRMCVVQNFSAVTGACLVVRKKLYEEVGGLDEMNLPVSFNDVDFCLKLRAAGYWNVWTPFVSLIHHESASRGLENTPEKKRRFAKEVTTMRQRWGELLDHDPAYNPNLTLKNEDWSLAWPPRAAKK
ncbi:MAG: hypothetical protein A3F67_07500 [Verrucomicrobia bacterium RIFCSPHIGHO2_12_FULL_41_10]|nr:MAG: hypothetical protein A3F67_07500 [Verrucomicrobia bacterium RIFCSPHIGHO2_12_FULL_41_10]HLB32798.1 glycosyltransferase family 2 protein [Chthoniobacterales bacterium]